MHHWADKKLINQRPTQVRAETQRSNGPPKQFSPWGHVLKPGDPELSIYFWAFLRQQYTSHIFIYSCFLYLFLLPGFTSWGIDSSKNTFVGLCRVRFAWMCCPQCSHYSHVVIERLKCGQSTPRCAVTLNTQRISKAQYTQVHVHTRAHTQAERSVAHAHLPYMPVSFVALCKYLHLIFVNRVMNFLGLCVCDMQVDGPWVGLRGFLKSRNRSYHV